MQRNMTMVAARGVMAFALAFGGMASVAGQGEAFAQTASAAQGYKIGPDDAIQVIVYGQPDAGIATRVKADGTIVMPFIGTVNVNGLDNVALAKLITDRMVSGGFLKEPVVNVEVTQYVSKSVNVAGKVTQPGIVSLDRPYSALEVLLKSGWIRENGANYVYLRRPGQPERRLSTEDLVRGTSDKDLRVMAGDTLFVPDADQFYIYGQINRPGSFPVLPGMTIRQAMAIAGGVTATGSANKVGLLRGTDKEQDADLSQAIEKNDVIVVKERLF